MQMRGQPGEAPRGSFGIPQQHREAMEAARKKHAEGETVPHTAPPPEVDPDYEVAGDAAAKEPSDEKNDVAKKTDPLAILKKSGIDITDDDIQSYIFKGFLEKKDILIAKGGGERKLVATLRTLTAEEYDHADELLAEEAKDKSMTNSGFDTRRQMWILSFGVVQLMGRPLRNIEKDIQDGKVKPDSSGEIGPKDRARLHCETLGKLAPAVVNNLMRLHGQITLAMNYLVGDMQNPL